MFGRQRGAEVRDDSPGRPADPDAELIARIAAGELAAFETLYRAYHPRLTRFLMQMLKRPHLVEEALNDTLLVVWRQPERYNGKSKVSTWIFAIAYRKALKALRRNDEPVEDRTFETRQSEEAGPEQQLGQRQVQQVLLNAIGELSHEHRTV